MSIVAYGEDERGSSLEPLLPRSRDVRHASPVTALTLIYTKSIKTSLFLNTLCF